MIGCTCDVCRSPDPRDRRWRPSIYIEGPDGGAVLVDTGPDLRAQALAYDVTRVDAILYTHGHADHVVGLDEVRRYNALQRGSIPCFADELTIGEITRMFGYAFDPRAPKGGGVPEIAFTPIRAGEPLAVAGLTIVPLTVYHGQRAVLGFRVGAFAYLTDCSRIPDETWPLLEGLDIVVLDALRERPHPTHFSLGEAVDAAGRLGAPRTYFTHICHDLSHAATCARLPPGMELAYDGLRLEWT